MEQQSGLRYFNTGEVAINYACQPGSGETVLFIHGIMSQLETWEDVAAQIAGGRQCFRVDLRGHGHSGHASSYLVPDYARDIATLLAAEHVSHAVIVGHSLGGLIALSMAESYPDMVKAIVLEDSPLYARDIMDNTDPGRLLGFRESAVLASSRLTRAEIVERLRQTNPDEPEESLDQRSRALFQTDGDAVMHIVDRRMDRSGVIDETIAAVQCPVLLMYGVFESGGWVRQKHIEHARPLFRDCAFSYWADAGHQLHRDYPDRFVNKVKQFLNSHLR